MGATFRETDTASTCSVAAYCSGQPLATVRDGRLASEGGTAGTVERTITIGVPNGEQQWIGVMFELVPGAGYSSWAAGNYVVRLDVTSDNPEMEWRDTYLCRINSACTNIASIGSLTGQAIVLDPGVLSMTISGAAVASPAATDKIVALLVFGNTTGLNQSFGYTPDQLIDTPIVAASDIAVLRRRRS